MSPRSPLGLPVSLAGLMLLPLLLLSPAAQAPGEELPRGSRPDAGNRKDAPPPAGVLVGRVIDAETKEPIAWATVAITDIHRGDITHGDGGFHLYDLPAGRYSLKVTHLGYQSVVQQVAVGDGDTTVLTIQLTPTPIQGQEVVVSSDRDAGEKRSYEPTEVLSGTKLQQQLGRTLAETLGSEAGVAQQSMGPAPARPVVRGFGGDRLLILQDGERTGDLSATSADHAVTVDPLTAERVEIVQGPASLLYSSNALGGVINVVGERIASSLPDRAHGTASLQGESVNTGYTGGLSLSLPAGPLAVQAEGSARRASDISTPAGELRNTDVATYSGSLGASLIGSWGYAGLGASTYSTDYGVPGGFTGAHRNGVRIELERSRGEARAELLQGKSLLRRLELHAGYTRYHHKEIESNGSVGTEYGVLTGEASATLHHGTLGPFARGAAGIWGEFRDFAAGGGAFIPNTTETNLAGFLYEELPAGDFTVQGALRFDLRVTDPATTGPSAIGEIRKRTFANVSGSASLLYDIGAGLRAGVTVMRSFRPPTIEELLSRGPHLASYSFEVGNPSLDEELGLGTELSLRYNGERGHAGIALFRNALANYIYPRNTGDTSFRLPLPIYQYTGNDAVIEGGELSGEYEVLQGLVAGGTMSYVRGTLRDNGRPLPSIPPLNGRLNLRYRSGPLTLGAAARGAAAQERLGEFEEPTAGYLVYDAFGQYQLSGTSLLHTVVLTLENLADTEYRMHLSRVKSIMPEPGRNLKILYRMYF